MTNSYEIKITFGNGDIRYAVVRCENCMDARQAAEDMAQALGLRPRRIDVHRIDLD